MDLLRSCEHKLTESPRQTLALLSFNRHMSAEVDYLLYARPIFGGPGSQVSSFLKHLGR